MPGYLKSGYVYGYGGKLIHIDVAERALGKPLPHGAHVHHWNSNPADNANSNLLICEDQAYHKLIHYRMRAYAATGDPNKLQCKFCRSWDDPVNLFVSAQRRTGRHIYHRSCSNAYCESRNRYGGKNKRRKQARNAAQ